MPWNLRSAVLPGALLALLVTCGSLLALALAIGLRSDENPPLSFGAGESTVTLRGTSDATSSQSARAKAAADALRVSAEAPGRLTTGLAVNTAGASAVRTSRPVQPRAVLRGTTRRRSTRRPAAQPQAPASPPASAPAVAAVPAPVVAAPAPTAAPEVPSRPHHTRHSAARRPQQGEGDRDRPHRDSDRRRGHGQEEPDTPPVPPAATPDPQSPGKDHHRGYPRHPRR